MTISDENEGASAFLFPGQGSQYVGMGSDLCAAFPVAQTAFDRADEVLEMPLSRLCFEGPEGTLNETSNTQPAILVTSVAALHVLETLGWQPPACVAGHSMGEFSALVAAGALSFEDGLRLVRERGRLMEEAGNQSPGGMAAILGMDRPAVEQVCAAARETTGAYVGIANDNCPGQMVISGAFEPLEQAMALAREQKAKKVVRLAISIAAHSPLMAEAADRFRAVLDQTPLEEPAVPVVANATASPLTDPDEIRDALERQLTSPVQWTESMNWVLAQGVNRFVEVGPKDVLIKIMKRIDRQTERISTNQALGGEE